MAAHTLLHHTQTHKQSKPQSKGGNLREDALFSNINTLVSRLQRKQELQAKEYTINLNSEKGENDGANVEFNVYGVIIEVRTKE